MSDPVEPTTSDQLDEVRALFGEYAISLGFGLEFQGFDEELERFPGEYQAPHGFLLVLVDDGRVVACVGVRQLEPRTCEMKRMYVLPEARGRGLGRRLARAAIGKARESGYARMRLDTVESLTAANALYESLGFVVIDPYRFNPRPDAVYMQLDLKKEPVEQSSTGSLD